MAARKIPHRQFPSRHGALALRPNAVTFYRNRIGRTRPSGTDYGVHENQGTEMGQLRVPQ